MKEANLKSVEIETVKPVTDLGEDSFLPNKTCIVK